MQAEAIAPVNKLTTDIKKAAKVLSEVEARYLVDLYYIWQEDRKRASSQVRSLNESGEPNDVINHMFLQSRTLENQCKAALDTYSNSLPVGRWMRANTGVGPVITAGLLAHIDITKAPTAGHIWSFAGLDPTKEWKKGEKRPWNANLKTLCWKLGESFVKVCNKEGADYGHIYLKRKELENLNNEKGEFKEQAKAKLEKFKIGKDTDAYASYIQGKLPPAHIHARAKRYAVKMFLSHLQTVMWYEKYKELPVKPFIIEHGGHVHYVPIPHSELIPGLAEALRKGGRS